MKRWGTLGIVVMWAACGGAPDASSAADVFGPSPGSSGDAEASGAPDPGSEASASDGSSSSGSSTSGGVEPETEGTGELDPTGGSSSEYFDLLVGRPDHHSSTALRSPEEVVEGVNFSDKDRATTAYDPVMDAARFIVRPGAGSVVIGDQVRHYFPFVDSGNLLFFWEARASSYWAKDGNVDGVETYKAFQLSKDGDLTLEPRFRFAQVDRPYVARTDVRTYGAIEKGPFDSVAGQTGEFNIMPETWTRFWIFLDFDNNELSYWVGDEDRATVQILNAVPYDWNTAHGSDFGFDEFWFEFNTSQERASAEEAYFWGRNLVILKDVDDPIDVVALGSHDG